MDLHFATEKVASLKDAALRYLVIVAGILTALALGQWTETRRNAQQGAQTLGAIRAELRRNQNALDRALDLQRKQLAQLTAAEATLGKDSFAVPDLQARAAMVLKDQSLSIGDYALVVLQRSAWDTAIASQSLQYVAKDEVVRFARAYAAGVEVADTARQIISSPASFNGLMTVDMYDRRELQDALRFARAIREYRLTLVGLNTAYTLLRASVNEALGDAAGAAASAAAR